MYKDVLIKTDMPKKYVYLNSWNTLRAASRRPTPVTSLWGRVRVRML